MPVKMALVVSQGPRQMSHLIQLPFFLFFFSKGQAELEGAVGRGLSPGSDGPCCLLFAQVMHWETILLGAKLR